MEECLSLLFSKSLHISLIHSLLPLLLQVLVYAELCCFKVELLLCTLKFLWSLAPQYTLLMVPRFSFLNFRELGLPSVTHQYFRPLLCDL